MSREQYVRPPLVAAEPPSPVAALWRFRLVAAVLAVLALVVLAWVFLSLSGVTNGEDPGLGALEPFVSSPAAP